MSLVWVRHLAILAGLFIGFYFLARGNVTYGPYAYDEADYMYAVSRGLAANYTDSPTMPLVEFLKFGLGRGKGAVRQTELSETIRNSGDIVFYRHWHGPLYTYFLSILEPFGPDERTMRAWGYVFPAATALLLYFGALWLLPRLAGQTAAILGVVLFLWSFAVLKATDLAPHELFVFCVLGALLFLAKLMLAGEEQARRYWYAAVIASALAFCTLEVAFALIATLLICGHAVREGLKPDAAFIAKSAGAFAGTVLLVWPAALFKLSFVKSYLFMAYLAVFRKGAWGSDVTVAGTWWMRFVTSPVPWILLALAIFLLATRRLAWPPVVLPFAIYSVSMFLAIFRVNTEIPRYVLPLIPGIVPLAAFTIGLWMARFRPAIRYGAIAVIAAAMFLTTFEQLKGLYPRNDSRAFALLDQIRHNDLARKRLLVPHFDLPMVHYYFPEAHVKSYSTEAEIPGELSGQAFDAVVCPDYLIHTVLTLTNSRIPCQLSSRP